MINKIKDQMSELTPPSPALSPAVRPRHVSPSPLLKPAMAPEPTSPVLRPLTEPELPSPALKPTLEPEASTTDEKHPDATGTSAENISHTTDTNEAAEASTTDEKHPDATGPSADMNEVAPQMRSTQTLPVQVLR